MADAPCSQVHGVHILTNDFVFQSYGFRVHHAIGFCTSAFASITSSNGGGLGVEENRQGTASQMMNRKQMKEGSISHSTRFRSMANCMGSEVNTQFSY